MSFDLPSLFLLPCHRTELTDFSQKFPPLLVALSGIDPDPERSPVLRSIRFQVWDGERGRFQNTYSMGGGMFKEKIDK